MIPNGFIVRTSSLAGGEESIDGSAWYARSPTHGACRPKSDCFRFGSDLLTTLKTLHDDSAAAAWNSIVAFKNTNDPKAQISSDQPKFTSNVYTDYRFTRGTLKNEPA